MNVLKVVVALLWVSIGMAVLAVEMKDKPELAGDMGAMTLSIALWPAFPLARAYRDWAS